MIKVLLVEDDPIEARLYINLLTREGFEIVALDSAEKCLATAQEMKPDIILLDVMMPKMNGFETLNLLLFNHDTQKIPIVLLTNLSDPHYEKEALTRGAAKYLVKSNTENAALVETIRDIVQAYRLKQT